MSSARRIFYGAFGRVALLDMDQSLVPHAHSECHVLLKVSGADTLFSVRGHAQPLTDRTAVLINAWEPHYYDHQPGIGDTLILALYIEPHWLAALQQGLLLSGRPDFFSEPCIALSPRLRRDAEQLISAMMSFGLVPQETFESLLFELLIGITEKHSAWHHLARLRVGIPEDFYDARIRRACDVLLHHPQGELDVAWVARECGLSRGHFFSLFKKSTGMTPQMMANIGKMQLAFQWLSDQRTGTLGNLSEALGFSEQGHFTRFFRRHIGASPSQCQKVIDSYSRRA